VNRSDSEKEYEKYLDSLSSRADLNYIFKDMLSEITSGHLRGGGGNIPLAKTIPGGLLGADYEIANGRYRFKKIYVGESWNPQLQSPLAQPGRLPAGYGTGRTDEFQSLLLRAVR